ncbi:serine/threonine protein kinase, CMGC, dual-specificity [Didymosphaeria variabile]|uniref:dual-specificity kinase n=1 Tax=Didymosphaeria variabile TaxID=1932322 RepID=A0A9W9C8L9_9PLEO|nr:serine/threonine protein kinase, CMGC, dual-specificity [Didymosphaeria variabile]KAJ4351204.1 serine/threonine protein kinase, CMGC, dual-specificity [Didymosphaeria variabile]
MVAQPPSRTRMESSLPVLSRASSPEESNGSTDGRVRKFQRTSGTDNTRRKSSAPNVTSAPRPPPQDHSTKTSFRGRRQSVRDHKVPLGPRPYEKQRVASDASAVAPQTRAFPAVPPVHDAASRFSFSTQAHPDAPADAGERFDFIPAVTFDDFANSLQYEPALSHFPQPPDSSTLASSHMAAPSQHQFTSSALGSSTQHAPSPFTSSTSETRPARSTSLVRRFSQSKNKGGPPNAPTEPSSIPPPASNMSIRTRRQSQFTTQPPPNPAGRAPRKSVGPGMLPTPNLDNRQEVPRLASHGDNVQTRMGRTSSFGQGNRRGTLPPGLTLGADATTRVPSATRAAKAKSLHVAPRQQSAMLNAPMASDPSRSPARTTARTQTPSSSSSKRQSTMHHVSGLGARTISPTDARRLKRLSMNPNPPGGPVSPPTPQADFSFDERAFNQSPAMIFRKSVTPSSARATPDQNPNRKSFASGISISSNSSLNSLRVGNSSLQPRNPALAGSRLPTPKPRNVHSSAGPEEEEWVPPVPAIPKAYESPKDPENKSFSFSTSALKASAALRPSPDRTTSDDMASISSLNPQTRGTESTKGDAAKKGKATIRHRRGLTVGAGSDAEKSPSIQSNKKNLQPIRLPPLNLLPLGTPFNNRISSFPAPSAELDDRNTTPPPKRAANKTPSTPMTASKASFFSRNNNVDQYDGGKHLRSSSSAFNLKSADTSLHGASAMPIPTLNPHRQVNTPFSSNSLPKNSGDYAVLFSRPSGEYKLSDTDAEMQNMKVQGPRAPQKDTDSAKTSTSTEPETPSSGSSLRRKLSLSGWRRASSKAATHNARTNQTRNAPQKSQETGPQPPKHGDMPPPKLPASATWSGAVGASPTPATRTRPSLDFGRRKASASTATTVASDTEAEKTRKANGGLGIRAASGYSEQPNGQAAPKSSSSILTPMQRMLGSKSSTNMLKARNLDTNLDRDDLVADEEMKKLASKRKDFEHAARDVDELRKRARPQERVTAAQALQMVSLNIFERGEIIDYKEIYFCGTKSAKKHVGDLNATTANFGYDDDRGDYNIVFGDHLAYRYEVVDLLGKGSFGQVVRCVDHKTGGLVAIKIIRNKKRFHQQALVEVNILQKLREWDPDNKHSMINFTQSFYFRGHLCISTELLGMNLYEFIKAHEFKGFSLRLIRRFCKQMLSSLVMLKSKRVIHCDLKPENILLAHPLHSEIKVIDFGSSCFENEKVYTYIQSRFYRSPEVILGMSYGLPIDMWSLGCILAELLTGYPIFPGENEQEQLACIMEIFGPPEKHLIEKSSRKKLFFDSMGKPRVTVSTKGRRRRPSSKTLQQALKCDDEAFLDFIARCLRWDPDRRMKPDEAMLHEFVTGVKRVARPRQPINGAANAASPIKRLAPSQTPSSRVRPLPEPPATSFKNGTAVASDRQVSGSSPVKSGPSGPRRQSTVPPAGLGIKRTVNGAPAPATSSLPRVAQRNVSGKSDLASAAAVASLKSSR